MVGITHPNDATLHRPQLKRVRFRTATDGGAATTTPNESSPVRQLIEAVEESQSKTSTSVRRSVWQASQINEVCVKEESFGDPSF
ncbi:hypothetical protein EG68_00588 [Paragonimus skrjabini miyazakii]|uniref:Uncharacterized protein n=1 Tax=Paragonimus skrjabini miyazakii TaxID=59628 RepID=A0A8S9Z9Z7_9TREM|nr:hypothetical protein EG68_00588 [Paragonimus skrjabini miyazakii]